MPKRVEYFWRIASYGDSVPDDILDSVRRFGVKQAILATNAQRFYTRLKAVTQRWPREAGAGAEFSMPTMK